MRKHLKMTLALCFLLPFIFLNNAYAGGKSATVRHHGWYGNNIEILSNMIAEHGKGSPGYDEKSPPVAAFDWDNTVIKNDVGDAVLFWMLANNKVLQPPKKDWRKLSPLLTFDAAAALKNACTSQAEPGKPLITNQTDAKSIACADEIFAIYDSGKTTSGAGAWKDGAQTETMEPAYAWAVSLQAGYTPAEIKSFAEQAIAFSLGNEVGAMQTIGSKKDITSYIRIYDQMKDLISALESAGFDVWVISASSQPLVEAFAARVGIASDCVIGIRAALDKKGKATARFQGCSQYPEKNYGIISYGQGKRCWLNKVAFGRTAPVSQMNDKSPLVFAAGDSDGDLYFLKDAEYRLVLNRNKAELMCNAYAGARSVNPADGVWIINPMFIKPKPKRTKPYDCSGYGLPDYVDLVYGP
ncbi:MAG: haloacid dehalogenase-like hydrolase [Proteobacteria bacterium]|nr:haloacid dehalogenase-like hydrolase [Pseudomonadota bacterium]